VLVGSDPRSTPLVLPPWSGSTGAIIAFSSSPSPVLPAEFDGDYYRKEDPDYTVGLKAPSDILLAITKTAES
jgi:hypothetical protein